MDAPQTSTDDHDAGPSDPYPFHHDPWWTKAVFFTFVVLPLLATGYAIWSFWGSQVGPWQLALLAGMWVATGIAISVGYHRMLTHRSVQVKAPARFVLLALASMALQGPPADWAATHLRHHAKADREGDPHSPLDGFWHAHFGWIMRDRFVRNGVAHTRLLEDPVTRAVQKTWFVWITLSFAIPALIGLWVTGTWFGFWSGLLWGGLVRVFLGHHITWSVNSLGHMFGTRPFAINDRATNNWLVAFLGWGEGWHNNHHAFPRAGYIGMRWYQIDFGSWLIVFLKAIGQVTKVIMPSREERRAKSKKNAT